MRGVVVAALMCSVKLAAAEVRPPEFPVSVVDRPLLLPAGATALEFDWQLRTFVDDLGRRSGFFDHGTLDLSIAHAFGPVEAGIGVGQLLYGWLSIDLGGPVLTGGAEFTAPQPNNTYYDDQYLEISDKLVVVPGGLATFGSITAYLSERRIDDALMTSGKAIALDPRAGFELQVDPNWAVIGAAVLGIPIAHPAEFDDRLSLGVTAELKLGFRYWDFYVEGTLHNVTRPERSTFLAGGFIKRWGI